MSSISIIIAYLLDKYIRQSKIKQFYFRLIARYSNLFTSKKPRSVKHIRQSFIFSIIPILAIGIALSVLFDNTIGYFFFFIFNTFIFCLACDFYSWRNVPHNNADDKLISRTIHSFMTHQFALVIYFLIMPSISGVVIYTLLNTSAQTIKKNNTESLVQFDVVDKMLFWLNLIPYSIMFVFISLAGDFDSTIYTLLKQKNKFKISSYYLEQLLNQLVLNSVRKTDTDLNDEVNESGLTKNNVYEINFYNHVKALLFRAFIMIFICIIILSIVHEI